MAMIEGTNENEQFNSSDDTRCDENVALNPDHPLMRRFQNAMYMHLKQQDQLLQDELKDLNSRVNHLDKERESIGEELYGFQQEIGKQQKLLQGFQERCTSLTANRIEREKNINVFQEKLKMEIEKNNYATKKEGELRHEKDRITMIYNHLMNLKNEMENNITISQKIKNKTEIDKNRLVEEKKKQDTLMLKITLEFFKLKHKINEIDTFTKLKEEEKAVLGLTIVDANADLEALKVEQNNLIKAWQGTILNIKQRDQKYFQLVEKERELTLKSCTIIGEIEGVKKASNKEMEKNEELTLLLHKVESNVENTKLENSRLNEKKNNQNLELSKFIQMLQHTEKDLQNAILASNRREHERNAAQRNIEKLSANQVLLEDQIMNLLQSQITEDKSAKYLHKMITKIKVTVREKELQLSCAENSMANSLLEIEQQDAENERLSLDIEDLNHKLHVMEKEMAEANEELKNSITHLGKRQNVLDILNKRLEKLLSVNGGVEMSSPEIKVMSLQNEIKEMHTQCESLKVLWIRHQGNMVELTQERNEQLKKIDTHQKEINLLVQKNLKLRNDIDKTVKEEGKIQRWIKNHQLKLSQLCLNLSEKKGNKETLGKTNVIMQNDFLNSLKDAESEYLRIQSTFEEIIFEREQLKEELLTMQRISLSWERKIQMVVETKQALDKENGANGDIYTMKGEIHRMQVRLGQLCQVQERLASDLEKCVTKREAITYAARVREKKALDTSTKQMQSQTLIKRKIEELHRHVKLVAVEIKSIEQQLLSAKEQITESHVKLSERQERVLKMKKAVEEIITDIAEKRMKKLQNLEDLVRSQKLVRKYQDIKGGRYHPQCTSEATLQSEMQVTTKSNDDIKEVITILKTDFPSQFLSLSRIESCLEVRAL